MAVDKKSDYVGNHGGAYTDNDGMRRQFTMIDHDVKSKLAIPPTQEEFDEAKDYLKTYRSDLVQKIMEISPSYCPTIFDDFTIRGDRQTINWNRQMLIDEGMPLDKLRDIYTLTSNKQKLKLQGISI